MSPTCAFAIVITPSIFGVAFILMKKNVCIFEPSLNSALKTY
ncbi:putative NADH dehydrogenase subunit 1 [Listeria innocua FSL S4-378]|nr:putative NADH dehydrogenase subunit 1 [Listeria innocua FSL S4-378]